MRLIITNDMIRVLFSFQVKKAETSLWPDAITYALAVCAQQDRSRTLQEAAYQALRTVCKSSRDILLFVKFFSELKGKKGWYTLYLK